MKKWLLLVIVPGLIALGLGFPSKAQVVVTIYQPPPNQWYVENL